MMIWSAVDIELKRTPSRFVFILVCKRHLHDRGGLGMSLVLATSGLPRLPVRESSELGSWLFIIKYVRGTYACEYGSIEVSI